VRRIGSGRHPADHARPPACPIGPSPSSRSRGCSAALRPLCGDCAGPMRRYRVYGLWRARPARGPARLTKEHGSQRPEPRAGVKAREATAQRLGLEAEHGSGRRAFDPPRSFSAPAGNAAGEAGRMGCGKQSVMVGLRTLRGCDAPSRASSAQTPSGLRPPSPASLEKEGARRRFRRDGGERKLDSLTTFECGYII